MRVGSGKAKAWCGEKDTATASLTRTCEALTEYLNALGTQMLIMFNNIVCNMLGLYVL